MPRPAGLPAASMPLAQLAEPWPNMELVQLDTEVSGAGDGDPQGSRGTKESPAGLLLPSSLPFFLPFLPPSSLPSFPPLLPRCSG